jgi:hypothetical protein
MILVAPRVLAVAAYWLNFSRFLSLRSLRSFAAIPVFFVAAVWSLPGLGAQEKAGNDQSLSTNHQSLLTSHPFDALNACSGQASHFSPLTSHSGRSV